MSSESSVPEEVRQRAPGTYTGPERYWRAFEDWYDATLSPEQREICEHVATHQYTHLEGGNGFGKTFAIVALALAFHRRHYPSSVVVTSGTYGKLKRTFCADAEQLHDGSPFSEESPYWPRGEWKWSPNPHIDVAGEPVWQFEVHSPEDPGELEGVHNDYTLVIVDEADKKDVDLDTLDSMDSLISDRNDRMVVISNPPADETNAVANLDEIGLGAAKLQLSTFDSHNVQVELGRRDGGRIPGLTGLHKLRKKWEALNDEPWPGYEEARAQSTPSSPQFRDDLDERWYRRFAGVIPPQGAAAHRPFDVADVQAAWEREAQTTRQTPNASGVDVARAGDRTVLASVHADAMRIHYAEQGTNHAAQEAALRDCLDDWPDHPTPVDAVGEGSGLADRLGEAFPEALRFKAGGTPAESTEYDDCWAEGLAALGRWLRDGGSIDSRKLREELLAAARSIEYDVRHLASRGQDGADVLTATSKDAIKERLGRSPDYLDAAMMAAWAAEGGANVGRQKAPPTISW